MFLKSNKLRASGRQKPTPSASPSGASFSLATLAPGKRALVTGLQLDGLLYRRLLDLGILAGTEIEAVHASPAGDPVVYRVRGAQIALRKQDADLVRVQPLDLPFETGVHHDTENAVSENEEKPSIQYTHPTCQRCSARTAKAEIKQIKHNFRIALAGNPNTGKSTVFNGLTGLRQHVGNWPGKTVMRAEGQYRHRNYRFFLTDLPGTYSLLSTSQEEEIARDFILFGAPDCTVVVVDATCLDRNLNLVVQILQITPRVVVCLNLMDEARRKGIAVDTKRLEKRLAVPVVASAARQGEGLDSLQEAIYQVASGEVTPTPPILRYDAPLEAAVEGLIPEIEAALPEVPNARWIALRLLDGGDIRLEETLKGGICAFNGGSVG